MCLLNNVRPSLYPLNMTFEGRVAYSSIVDRIPHLLRILVQLGGSWIPAPTWVESVSYYGRALRYLMKTITNLIRTTRLFKYSHAVACSLDCDCGGDTRWSASHYSYVAFCHTCRVLSDKAKNLLFVFGSFRGP